MQHFAWVGHKGQQQLVLCARKLNGFTVVLQRVIHHVQAVAGKHIAVFTGILRRGAGQIDTPQKIFYPHYQLAQFQRLGDVVVRAHLQSDDAVYLVATPRHQNNAHRGTFA